MAAPVRRNASLALLPFMTGVSTRFELEQVACMFPSYWFESVSYQAAPLIHTTAKL